MDRDENGNYVLKSKTMVDKIVELVEARDHVSFAELNQIDGFQALKDDAETSCIWASIDHKMLMWTGMSAAGAAAVTEAMDAKRVHPVPCAWLTYLIDGCMLQMPIVKSVRKYAKPHWLPTVLRPGPPPKVKEKTRRSARRD